MARNAKLDLAKRQAVGIYRKASPMSSINHGVAVFSGGDYRSPEGAKACYLGKLQVPAYDLAMVKRLPGATHHADNRKRCGSDPRQRSNLTMSGIRSAGPKMRAVVGWNSYEQGESRLISYAALRLPWRVCYPRVTNCNHVGA
jgi:hypothetical protein